MSSALVVRAGVEAIAAGAVPATRAAASTNRSVFFIRSPFSFVGRRSYSHNLTLSDRPGFPRLPARGPGSGERKRNRPLGDDEGGGIPRPLRILRADAPKSAFAWN